MATNLKLIEPEANSDAQLRLTLRRDIRDRDSALTARDNAKTVVETAQEHLIAVDAELTKYNSLDSDIADSRAVQIAISLENGGGFPELTTPPELAQLAAQRADAHNRLSAISQATMRLEANLKEAENVLATHQANVANAARNVVAHYADAMARELAILEEKASATRRLLLGVTATRPGGSFPVASSTVALLRDDPINSICSRNTGADASWWDSWFARLLHDAEAKPNSE